jgi:tRNA dimethylallyltransferase
LKTHHVLALVGPTASGKTATSLILAESLDGEIVSADSRQIYKYMDIGTAKPSKADRCRVPHHFIDVLEPTAEYSAGQYGLEARSVIEQIKGRGRVPILVGGSGLYLKAVIDGLGDVPAAKKEIREELAEEYKRLGLSHLVEELRTVDTATLQAMKQVNARRVIRALEVYRTSGIPFSRLSKKQDRMRSLDVIQIGLRWDRSDLNKRIDERIDKMIHDGLIEETRQLLSRGFRRNLNSFNTVGYKEVCDFLEGRTTREFMLDAIKRNTRRFAKRQMTWFRADKRIHWIDVLPETQPGKIAEEVGRAFREGVEPVA